MFKDYYAILQVDENATQKEIKIAFKKQAIKWHPDKNIGKDTTPKMQEINEAYLILNDIEARKRYYREYQTFKQYKKKKKKPQTKETNRGQHQEKEKHKQEEKTYEYNYEFEDDILKKWMNNAKQQAVELAKQTIEDIIAMSKVGAKVAGKELILQITVAIILLFLFALTKSCNG